LLLISFAISKTHNKTPVEIEKNVYLHLLLTIVNNTLTGETGLPKELFDYIFTRFEMLREIMKTVMETFLKAFLDFFKALNIVMSVKRLEMVPRILSMMQIEIPKSVDHKLRHKFCYITNLFTNCSIFSQNE